MEKQPNDGDLRVWHIINPPREAFRFPVRDFTEATRIKAVLASYDLFLGEGECFEDLTTIGERRAMRLKLIDATHPLINRHRLGAALNAYNEYQGKACNGVPIVIMNVQGCEVFEDGEWVEYDPEDEIIMQRNELEVQVVDEAHLEAWKKVEKHLFGALGTPASKKELRKKRAQIRTVNK